MTLLRLCSFFFLIALCSSCERSIEPVEIERASPRTYFPIHIGDKTLHLQLALHQAEREQGLMYRESLDPDHGMVFIFEEAGPRGFWMRNTRIPLDLAYLDASGTVLEIHKLYPYDEVSVNSRSQEVVIVVEMNRGWFKRNQITAGASLNMQELVAAIKARGVKLEQFPLNLDD